MPIYGSRLDNNLKFTISYLTFVILFSQGQQFLRDFYPIQEKLPFLPTGDFVLLMAWKFYGNIQFVTNLNFTFVE